MFMCVYICAYVCVLLRAEESAGADQDDEVSAAGGAGVPHRSVGHSGAARGAGEELPGRPGGVQENHREAGHAGLIRLDKLPCLPACLLAQT